MNAELPAGPKWKVKLSGPKMSYRQQLRDPRWITRSVQLKEEAGWRCEHCKRPQGEVELQIHHTFYDGELYLWEYPRCLLICLCDEHHQERQAVERTIYINVADVLRDK